MSETILWEKSGSLFVNCQLCAHGCRIKNGGKGRCGVRVNRNGKLFSVVTDLVSSIQLDPVEKKPLYHFLPGTKTFSIGSVGCNFRCTFCQNHHISVIPEDGIVKGKRTNSDAIIDLACRSAAKSIALTYNEPTVFVELLKECAEQAHVHQLPVIIVSNGFMSNAFFNLLGRHIQAANIDLKAFNNKFYEEYCGGKLQPVLDNLKRIKELGWWLEITTLVIPGVNDDPKELAAAARFIKEELGADVPWHLTAFHGAHKMSGHPATTADQLGVAWNIGKEVGLHFVYIGNVVHPVGTNTYCPSCGAVVCERRTWKISYPKNGLCPECGMQIPGVWQ